MTVREHQGGARDDNHCAIAWILQPFFSLSIYRPTISLRLYAQSPGSTKM